MGVCCYSTQRRFWSLALARGVSPLFLFEREKNDKNPKTNPLVGVEDCQNGNRITPLKVNGRCLIRYLVLKKCLDRKLPENSVHFGKLKWHQYKSCLKGFKKLDLVQ